MLASAFSLVEVAVLCAGAAIWFHTPGRRLSDSLCLGVLTALIALSASFQAAFLLSAPALSLGVEGVLLAAALTVLVRHGARLQSARDDALGLWRQAPVSLSLLALAWCYLFAQTFLLPPHTSDALTYHLPRVLLFQQDATLLPEHFSKYHLVAFPTGGDILNHLFLRWHSDYASASLQWLAYVAIVIGAYALARRHARREAALATSFVVASLPQLVAQSTVAKNNVFAALAALAALLLAERLRDRLERRDALLLVFVLAFGLSAKTSFLAFGAPFVICFGVALVRRHGLAAWARLVRRCALPALALALPLWVVGQVWLFSHNQAEYGDPLGPPDFVAFHRNGDGGLGAAANLVRYALQAPHLLEPVDAGVRALTGISVPSALDTLYTDCCADFFAGAGSNANWQFDITWKPGPETSWFGPLGFALLLPSLLIAPWLRGPRRDSRIAASATLITAWVLFAWAVAWFPWNARMLSPVFVGASLCLAALLERWTPAAAGWTSLRGLCLAILLWVCASAHPFAEWRASDYGADRLVGAQRYLGSSTQTTLATPLAAGSRVALVTRGDAWPYFFLLRHPQVEFTLVRPFLRRHEPDLDLASLRASHDQVLCLTRERDFCRDARPGEQP